MFSSIIGSRAYTYITIMFVLRALHSFSARLVDMKPNKSHLQPEIPGCKQLNFITFNVGILSSRVLSVNKYSVMSHLVIIIYVSIPTELTDCIRGVR